MSQRELSRSDSGCLQLGRLPVMEPSADLWERIAAAHRQRTRRRRALRSGAAAVGAVVLALAVASGWFGRFDNGGGPAAEGIDWKGRAQALEMQLHQVRGNGGTEAAGIARDARGELVLVDAALQAAYDDAAPRERLNALWKRRSELLGILLATHRRDIRISRI